MNITKQIHHSATRILSFFSQVNTFYPQFAAPKKDKNEYPLNKHITRMLKTYQKYIKPNLDKNLQILCEKAIIFHDIGKLNPFFQYRMFPNNSIPKIIFNRSWSYHSLNSALFAFLCNYSHDKKQSIDGFIIANAIICHHSKILLLLTDVNQFQDFQDNLESENPVSVTLFHLLLNYIQKTRPTIISEYILSPTVKKLMNSEESTLIGFFKVINKKLIKIKNKIITNPENYFKIALVASILSDLDIWEARTGRTNKSSNQTIKFDSQRKKQNYNKVLIQDYFARKMQNVDKIPPLLPIRQDFQQSIIDQLPSLTTNRIYTITAPTGIGKTMGIIQTAFFLRNLYFKKNKIPKVIYALPFLSICDQIEENLKDLFSLGTTQNKILTVHHSMALHNTATKKKNTQLDFIHEEKSKSKTFEFLPTLPPYEITHWQSHFVVTTTVRLFNTLMRYYKQDLIRFHRLMNSIIIIDEYHSLSVEYFRFLRESLPIICKLLNCTFILATATTPVLFTATTQVKELASTQVFQELDRYDIDISDYREEKTVEDFKEIIIQTIEQSPSQTLLIIVNTRELAYDIYNFLKKEKQEASYKVLKNFKIKHLSSNITPEDRKEKIAHLNTLLDHRKPLVLVTTQLIEAGVDVSFQALIRQSAPLSAIIQGAGRVNRSAEMHQKAQVKLVNLPTKGSIYHPTDMKLTYDFLCDLCPSSEYLLSERMIRKNYAAYAQLVQDCRKLSVAYPEFQQIDYLGVCDKFKIINSNAPITIFVCDLSPEAETQLKTKIQKNRQVPSQYFQNSITLYENAHWKSFKEKYLPTGRLQYLNPSDSEEIEDGVQFYLINTIHDFSSDLYNRSVGLRIFCLKKTKNN